MVTHFQRFPKRGTSEFIADKLNSNGMSYKTTCLNCPVTDPTILYDSSIFYNYLHSKRWTPFSEKHTNHMAPMNLIWMIRLGPFISDIQATNSKQKNICHVNVDKSICLRSPNTCAMPKGPFTLSKRELEETECLVCSLLPLNVAFTCELESNSTFFSCALWNSQQ